MAEVDDLEFVVTGTEKEALILENILIKKHRPRYNVIYRDDKTYVNLRLTGSVSRGAPHPPAAARWRALLRSVRVEQALQETLKAGARLPPAPVHRRRLRRRTRPCLYYYIGHCPAPCVGRVDEAEYRRRGEAGDQYLSGQQRKMIAGMEQRTADRSAWSSRMRRSTATRCRPSGG